MQNFWSILNFWFACSIVRNSYDLHSSWYCCLNSTWRVFKNETLQKNWKIKFFVVNRLLKVTELTFSKFITSSNRLAATLKISGDGFPFLTSGSLAPRTMWLNAWKSSLWFFDFMAKDSLELLVATQIGMLWLYKW